MGETLTMQEGGGVASRVPLCRASRSTVALAAVVATVLPFPLHAQAGTRATAPVTAQALVDELLTTDVSFSAASATRSLVTGLTAMFAADVTMPAPGGFAEGRDEAMASLRRDSLNATSRAVWTPVRGGVSADGLHGFTFGFMTVMRADGTRIPLKYLAYWVRGTDGWRVAAYKRGRRPEGDVSLAMMEPALPAVLVPATTDITRIDLHRTSLAQAESDFSDDAQGMGVGPAFAKWGSADAMNLGGPANPGFVIGNEAIGKQIALDHPAVPAAINWSSEHVLVASSGDLGVSIGYIRPNEVARAGAESAGSVAATPPPGGAQDPAVSRGIPFFTVWRRASPDAPWRYVAE